MCRLELIQDICIYSNLSSLFVTFKAIFFKTPATNKPGQKQEDDTLVTNNNKNIVSHAVKNCHNNFTPQSTGAMSLITPVLSTFQC